MDNLPPPIQVIQGDGKGGHDPKDDDSLIKGEFKVKNPFQNFFDWIKNFIKKQSSITIKIPIVGIAIFASFGIGLGSGYRWGINDALSKLFPDSSPILHRAISVEGIIQKSSTAQYYLKSEGNTLWTLKPVNPAINLADYLNNAVMVKGNLTKEKLVIEVSEIIPLETPSSASSSTSFTPRSLDGVGPNPPNTPSTPNLPATNLPDLYPALDWQTTQKRVLIFTSGKRKIEQEGTYLESAQIPLFPQDFINYYIGEFKAQSFKETFNSISPEGITITYAKDDLFLTFGIKNIYQGSGDKKQLAGYKAYIEHN